MRRDYDKELLEGVCCVCGKGYRDGNHHCDPKVINRIEAGRKRHNTRMFYEKRMYGDRLAGDVYA